MKAIRPGAAALLITRFEIQAGLALVGLVVLAVVTAGVRYALARRGAS
jgi:hypothetical protein